MAWPEDLTSSALAAPEELASWPVERWSLLFRQARAAGLLGRVADIVQALGTSTAPALADHFDAARRLGRAQQHEIRREVRYLGRALASLGEPVLLLKGAAYVMADLPAASGRVFADTDIMVPKRVLLRAETLLMHAGWLTTHPSAYDQRYYRKWMHELPPMEHAQRRTVLDVHHTILPETAWLHPDPARFFEDAAPLAQAPGLSVLSPLDMVLHGMTHLFMNDDMSHALRDLSDLDLLLRHFGRDPGFWTALAPRARVLDLRRPLWYGLRYTARCLRTPIPPAATAAIADAAPRPGLRQLMDAIWLRALRSPHPDAAPPGRSLALLALYVRGHWLRMPPLLLLRHLTIKALRLHQFAAQAGAPR
jgi:hypothetical protein